MFASLVCRKFGPRLASSCKLRNKSLHLCSSFTTHPRQDTSFAKTLERLDREEDADVNERGDDIEPTEYTLQDANLVMEERIDYAGPPLKDDKQRYKRDKARKRVLVSKEEQKAYHREQVRASALMSNDEQFKEAFMDPRTNQAIEDDLEHQETVAWVEGLLIRGLGLTDNEIRKMRRRFPPLTRPATPSRIKQKYKHKQYRGDEELDILDLSENLPSLLGYWKDELGLRDQEARALLIVRPEMLGETVEHQRETIEWLVNELYWTRAQARQRMFGLMFTFGRFIQSHDVRERGLPPLLTWLRKDLALSKQETGRVLAKHAWLMGKDPAADLTPKLRWLQEALALSRKAEVVRLIKKLPELLNCNVEDELAPKLQWLTEQLVLEKEQLSQLICKEPSLLLIEADVGPLLWLENQFGLIRQQTSHLICRLPQLLSRTSYRSLEAKQEMVEKIQFLHKELKLEHKYEAVAMVVQQPLLLRQSDDNVRAKAAFYREKMRATDDQLRQAMVSSPQRYLSASVEHRLRPRVTALEHLGITPTFARHRTLVVLASEDDFVRRLQLLPGGTRVASLYVMRYGMEGGPKEDDAAGGGRGG